ncbi:hypothetical protein [Salinimicrobium sediminilitoris]|uniref:hypothetical protein n=1 Tax=Salinimicrobium sediminilitoris TaxID=2876715 RepID=UPI001E651912|nr:hypothetical protein [Salinimicrobium sediminilitoris]MCC8358921.1 hypothetical protein [Salinimicrobium sediminilitoris]
MEKINIYYTRMTYYYLHRRGYDLKRAKNKAFTKTTLLLGVYLFFVYVAVMNIANQLIFHLDNNRKNGLLIITPFVLLAYLFAEKKLKHRLRLIENVDEYKREKLRTYNRFQIRVAIIAGIYAIIMFCLIRLTNIYLL